MTTPEPTDDRTDHQARVLVRRERLLITAMVEDAVRWTMDKLGDDDDIDIAARLFQYMSARWGTQGCYSALLVLSDIYLDHMTDGAFAQGQDVRRMGPSSYREALTGGEPIKGPPPTRAVGWLDDLVSARVARNADKFVAVFTRWLDEVAATADVDDTDDPDAPFMWPMQAVRSTAGLMRFYPRGVGLVQGAANRDAARSWN